MIHQPLLTVFHFPAEIYLGSHERFGSSLDSERSDLLGVGGDVFQGGMNAESFIQDQMNAAQLIIDTLRSDRQKPAHSQRRASRKPIRSRAGNHAQITFLAPAGS